ncbi:unnamed protein product [Cylicostephanus goldi]|uniref:Uncharacterized protein n=1 Tax=Cylicostephanus goldi TaxID=71465 RepID=A0A3P7PRC4_CYLGO|nr:unnamed protein product [Cylicostephanus goldi]
MNTKNIGVDFLRSKTLRRKISNGISRRARRKDGQPRDQLVRFSPILLVDSATNDIKEDCGCPKQETGTY